MNKENILKYLNKEINLTVLQETPSTHILAKNSALGGAEEFTTFIAGSQTAGRGRYGNSFFSPSDTGIYLSTIVKPDIPPEDGWKITTSAAVAAVRAVNSVFYADAKIKWVNDIFVNNKKAAGILCEAVGQNMEYAVVGIGINVVPPKDGFPLNLPHAGAITHRANGDDFDRLCASFLSEFFSLYKTDCLDEYRKNCFILGKTVYVNDIPYTALAVNDCGNLLVKNQLSGEEKTLSSGEISIKIIG